MDTVDVFFLNDFCHAVEGNLTRAWMQNLERLFMNNVMGKWPA